MKLKLFLFSILAMVSIFAIASPSPIDPSPDISPVWLDDGTPAERAFVQLDIPQNLTVQDIGLAVESSFAEYMNYGDASIYSAEFSEIFADAIEPPNLSVLGIYVYEAKLKYSRADVPDHERTLNAIIRVDARSPENSYLIVSPIFWQCKADDRVAWVRFFDKNSGDIGDYQKLEYDPARDAAHKASVGLVETLYTYFQAQAPQLE